MGLEKCSSVRQIGIGNILRRLFAKNLLIIVCKEAIRAGFLHRKLQSLDETRCDQNYKHIFSVIKYLIMLK